MRLHRFDTMSGGPKLFPTTNIRLTLVSVNVFFKYKIMNHRYPGLEMYPGLVPMLFKVSKNLFLK